MDKKNLTSAVDPFITIRQSVQPISVTLLQTGFTLHSHKTGDGPFGLLVIAAEEAESPVFASPQTL